MKMPVGPRLLLIALAATILVLGACQSGPVVKSRDGVVRVDVTPKGFEPASVQIPAGQPTTIVMTRKTEQTCATEVVFASLNQHYTLPMNEAVSIKLPALPKGTVKYACGMNMIEGQVIVR